MVAELTPRLYFSNSTFELMGVTVSIYSRITRPSMFSWRSGSFSMVFGVSTLEGRVLKPAQKLYSVDRRVSMRGDVRVHSRMVVNFWRRPRADRSCRTGPPPAG